MLAELRDELGLNMGGSCWESEGKERERERVKGDDERLMKNEGMK